MPLKISRNTPGAILQPQPPPWAKEVKRGALFAKEEVIGQIYHATPLHYDPPPARSFAPVPCHLLERSLEVSFVEEIKSLRLGEGDTFHGEGILAVTKALLQSGVAYVGGYQGATVIQERVHA